jgi:tape measure domain-containing protein
MADIPLGDITIKLRADASELLRGLEQARGALSQFAQTATGNLGPAAQTILTQFQRLGNASAGASTSIQALAASQNSLGSALTQTQTSLQQLSSRMAEVSQRTTAASAATGLWSQALAIASGIGIATSISAIVSQMVQFGTSVVTTGAQLQQLRASLSAVTGSLAQGRDAFSSIVSVANQYGLSITTLATQFRSLSAATRGTALEGADTAKLFSTLAAASRTFGLSTEQTGRALLAFQQIVSKGVVSQEELRQQLAEALPGSAQIAARAFGRTTEQMDAMLKKGVDMVQFVRAFTAQLASELPKSTGAIETASQAFTRLGNEILLLKDRLAQSGILQFFGDLAGKAASLLEGGRTEAEQRARAVQTRVAADSGGLKVSDARDEARRTEVTGKLLAAEAALAELRKVRDEQAFGPLAAAGVSDAQVSQAQEAIDLLRREQTELFAVIKLRELTRRGATARTEGVESDDRLTTQEQTARDAAAANERLRTVLAGTTDALKTLDAQALETPRVFGNLTGNAEQQLTFLDARIEHLREGLTKITEQIIARPNTQGVPPADLTAQKAGLEAQLIAAETQKAAIKQAQEDAEKAAREAEAARQKALREAAADAQHYQQAVDQVTMSLARQRDEGLATLARLASGYQQTRESRDEDTASALAAKFAGDEEIQSSAALVASLAERRTAYKAELQDLQSRFIAFKQNADAAREAGEATASFSGKINAAIRQQMAPREERPELRLRAEAESQGIAIDPAMEQSLKNLTLLRQEQARLNVATQLWGDLSSGIGTAWSDALLGIAEHTKTVSQAFRDMGRSILRTMTEIASQEATRALFRLGVGILTSALTSSTMTNSTAGGALYQAPSSGATPSNPPPLIFSQSGSVVTRPTLMVLGESAATTPEYVLTRDHMKSLMSSAAQAMQPAGGSQGDRGVTIINVTSQEQAAQAKAQQEALGRQVILNTILGEMGAGEGSQINRMIRRLQR